MNCLSYLKNTIFTDKLIAVVNSAAENKNSRSTEWEFLNVLFLFNPVEFGNNIPRFLRGIRYFKHMRIFGADHTVIG